MGYQSQMLVLQWTRQRFYFHFFAMKVKYIKEPTGKWRLGGALTNTKPHHDLNLQLWGPLYLPAPTKSPVFYKCDGSTSSLAAFWIVFGKKLLLGSPVFSKKESHKLTNVKSFSLRPFQSGKNSPKRDKVATVGSYYYCHSMTSF